MNIQKFVVVMTSYTQSITETMTERGMCFEIQYHISVYCHFCNEHFIDYARYNIHLQEHYANDNHKRWLKCDFGCSPLKKFSNSPSFIGHISKHTGNTMSIEM